MLTLEQQVARFGAVANGMEVRFVDPLDDPGWDRKIAHFDGATFFHSAAWGRVLKETYGFPPLYAVAERAGDMCGVLPLMEVNNFPKGRRGVSLPFTDECCGLSHELQVLKQLTGAMMEEGRRRRWNYAEVRGTPIANAEAALSFYRHRLQLQSADKMFAQFDSSVQRAIRKAERSGVTTEISDALDAVRVFYRLHEGTRHKHGVPPQSSAFFANTHRNTSSGGRVTGWLRRRAAASDSRALLKAS